jgi:hypothetical protein
MRFVESAGIEAILPEMSYPMTTGVEVEGVTAMSAAQGRGEGLRLFGDRHEVDMIAHEAISKNAKASLRGVGLEAIEVGTTVGIREEHPLLVNATLRDVVRRPEGDGTWKSGHLLEKWPRRPISLFVPYLSVPEVRTKFATTTAAISTMGLHRIRRSTATNRPGSSSSLKAARPQE